MESLLNEEWQRCRESRAEGGRLSSSNVDRADAGLGRASVASIIVLRPVSSVGRVGVSGGFGM